jgi:hypothetical protein
MSDETSLRPLAETSALRVRTSTHEMDDLETIALVEDRLRPTVAGNDIAIQFDGDPVELHAEGFDERGECEAIGGFEGLFFPIDVEFHARRFRRCEKYDGIVAQELFSFAQHKLSGCSAALEIGLNQQRGIGQS